uniref:Uncharacterized protein n=1 Tax=Arundo donax TaxID=35708 RepID=A0A0A9AFT4_ARUDO
MTFYMVATIVMAPDFTLYASKFLYTYTTIIYITNKSLHRNI